MQKVHAEVIFHHVDVFHRADFFHQRALKLTARRVAERMQNARHRMAAFARQRHFAVAGLVKARAPRNQRFNAFGRVGHQLAHSVFVA